MNLKKRNKQAKTSTVTIVFYVFAIIFLLYGAYMVYAVYDYLSASYEANSLSMGSQLESVIQYFMTNSSAYFVYAIICYGFGVVIQMLHAAKACIPLVNSVESEAACDEEIMIEASEVSSAV